MELSFVLYLLAAFTIIPGSYFLLSVFHKHIAGGISAIGLLVLFILYGVQTYNVDGTYVSKTSSSALLKPISVCPDFLSLYMKRDNTYVCVDTVGVAPSGGITVYDTKSSTDPSDSQSFPLTNIVNSKPADVPLATIISNCKSKKVTWEGIWDGITQYPNTPPSPTS